jgi:protein-S-isoprenylcysteine O-methyltransferase Ste14
MADVVSVTLLAALWCTVHSALVSRGCDRLVRRLLGRRAAWQRLVYNLFSAATLAWCWLEFRARPGAPLWDWHGLWQVPRVAGLALGLWLGWLGTRAYDNAAFLGLRQVRDLRAGREPRPPRLSRAGVLGMVRHPYYTSGILLVALYDDFTTTTVAFRAVFVLYLLLGTWLEERKLLVEHGEAYRAYQAEVPALLPRRLIP